MEKFAIGVVIGGITGALITANNYKMRTLVKKGQAEVMAKLEKLMDDKIEEMEESAQELKEQAKEKIEDGVERLTEKKPKKTVKKTAQA